MRTRSKNYFKCLALALIPAAVLIFATSLPAFAQQEEEGLPEKTFKIIKEYPHTESKSQGRTGTCWCFSTTSLFESEAMRLGKGEFELSEMYTVHLIYIEKAKAYVRMHGNNNFGQGGLYHDVLWVLKNYGAVRDSDVDGLWDYEEGHNHGELWRVLKGYLDGVIEGGRRGGPSPKWLDGFKQILDVYLGPLPETIEVDGKQMTPKQFADDALGLNPDDYVEITSFSHMPFYQQVELLVPDNWSHSDQFYNVPIEDLMAILKHSLMNGYTAVYGGDVSEESYSSKVGYAIWQEDEVITQEVRERMWDDWGTTDDHAMHIVGIAEDEDGKLFYRIKDSGGKERGPYEGHIYMSENYIRAKADAVLVHKDSIPGEIRAKLGIE